MLTQEKKILKSIEKEKALRAQIELEGRRGVEPNLLNISKKIDEYYCLNKLELYCAYLNYTSINSSFSDYSKSDFLFLEEVIHETVLKNFNNPLIETYYYLRLLLESVRKGNQEDEAIFQQLSDKIPALMDGVSNGEQVKVYSYLTNYCAYKFNFKQTHYLKYFLTYSVRMLNIKSKTVKKNDRFLPPTTFRNIVTAALHLKDDDLFFTTLQEQNLQKNPESNAYYQGMEWVEHFIQKYKDRLSKAHAETYYQYSVALVLFHKHQFVKAYRVLGNPFRLQGMFINLNSRLLHLAILYELFNSRPIILENDGIEILKVIESFRGLIRDDQNRKQQLNPQYLAIYKNFEQLFKRLYKLNVKYHGLKPKPSTFSKFHDQLKVDIEKASIPLKDWMQQKLYELNNE